MIFAVKGHLLERHPTYVVLETHGISYQIYISLYTYSQLEGLHETRLLTHQIIKEDGHYLYGFASEKERHLFILLISVNGVGPNTARLILSSMEPESINLAIQAKDDLSFRKIKGVGPKTAQRIIVDLHDKVGKDVLFETVGMQSGDQAGIRTEAMSALVALGFNKQAIEQVFKNLQEWSDPDISLEKLIKAALKKLA